MITSRRVFQTALVTLAVFGLCLLAARLPAVIEFIQEGIIVPGLYLVWLVDLLMRTLHQALLWGIGLAIIAVIAIYALGFSGIGRAPDKPVVPPHPENQPPERGRLAYWRHHVRVLRSQGVESDYANYEFRRLAHSILDMHGGQSSGLEDENDGQAAEDVPPGITVFLRKNRSQPGAPPPRRRSRLWRRKPPATGPDPLDELTQYLERYLEVPHDDEH